MEARQNKGRPGWLPNLFDIVIIVLVILAAVGFLWMKGVIGGNSSGETEAPASGTRTLRYTVELAQMYGDSADMIQVGDTIVDGVRKYTMGKVVSVEVGDCITYSHDYELGTYKPVVVPGYKTAVVVLESECSETDTQITVGGGYLLRCGAAVKVRGPGYAGNGSILSIERG